MTVAKAEHAELLEFVYVSPFALAQIDEQGKVSMMNAKAVSLLMDLAPSSNLENLFEVLAVVAPEAETMIRRCDKKHGLICEGHRIEVVTPDVEPMVLSLTLTKLSTNRIMAAFADVSKLEAAHRARRFVLENVSDGLATVRRDGTLAEECSLAFARWLGKPTEGELVWSFFGRHDAGFAACVQMAWKMLQTGTLPVEVYLDSLPDRLDLGPLPLGFLWQPIYSGNVASHVLVVVRDLSAELMNERLEEGQRELMATLARLVENRREFRSFVTDATEIVKQIVARPQAPETMRLLHTLKGNAGMMSLHRFAKLCHTLEERVISRDGLKAVDTSALQDHWDDLLGRFVPLLSPEQPGVTMTSAEHRALVSMARGGAPSAHLAIALEAFSLSPVRPFLDRFAVEARALAERLGKTHVHVRVRADESIRHDADAFSAFWAAFVHAVRNAVDHGVDTGEERALAGKDPTATVELVATSTPFGLTIEIKDDGPGIDWASVRARAAAAGLPAASDAALIEALFAEGVSTRDSASETSGRGVGLAALKHACDTLGGSITVETRKAAGTTMRFRFPRTSAAFAVEQRSMVAAKPAGTAHVERGSP